MSAADVYKIRGCRMCGSRLEKGFTLDAPKVSQFPLAGEELSFPQVPLSLVICAICRLIQLEHTTPREWLYAQYWYRSSLNEAMVEALGMIVATARDKQFLHRSDWVTDIGANDGTLLRMYAALGSNDWEDPPRSGPENFVVPQRMAIEPAQNIQKTLAQHCEIVLPDYFPPRGGYKGPKSKIVTSVAMFYDLDSPDEFVKSMKDLLAEDGLWVLQYADLQCLYEQNAWDGICHEHLEYYGLRPVLHLLRRHGFGVESFERNDVNGGSIRLYIRPNTRHCQEVNKEADAEEVAGYYDTLKLQELGTRIADNISRVKAYLQWILDGGGTVDILGASTKGNTYLQVLGWDGFRQAVDRNADKLGRCTVTGVPIVSEEEAAKEPPDAYLVLPWHFKKGILEREQKALAAGTRLVFPLPKPVAVDKDGEVEL